jgi:predicted nucleic acid-binding protein
VNLFLDSSVILAACGRPSGASRYVFDRATQFGWQLLTSTYVVTEVERNLQLRMPATALSEWQQLAPKLERVADIVTFQWPTVFDAGKDRPILFTAVAFSDVLLTLDHADFGSLMTTGFYGLEVLTPGGFLRRERDAGRLS